MTKRKAAAIWVEVDALRPWSQNPRKNEDAVAEVAKSIRRFGWGSPIVANERTQEIIAGHTRWQAAQRLGLDQVPVRWVDLDPADAHALALADNRTSEVATWDDALLQEVLRELQSADDAILEDTGFSEEELQKFLVDPIEEFEGDPDEIPEVQEVAVTQRGDVWLMGEHRLRCGDSTDAADVAALLGEDQIDLVLTDPPYGVSYVGKTSDALTIENDSLGEDDLTALVTSAFDLAEKHCRPGAYWFASVPAGPLHLIFADDWKRRGILRQILVWVKDSMVLGRSEYHYQHEPILFGWIPGKRHSNNHDRTRTSVWQCARPKRSKEHPTMKPIELWSRAIIDGSRKKEIVFDPFLGSGTTLIASELHGRRCRGLELAPKYCDVIVRRWQDMTGGEATRQSDGLTFAEVSDGSPD